MEKPTNYAHDTHFQKPLIIVSLAHNSSSFGIERWILKRERQKKAEKNETQNFIMTLTLSRASKAKRNISNRMCLAFELLQWIFTLCERVSECVCANKKTQREKIQIRCTLKD